MGLRVFALLSYESTGAQVLARVDDVSTGLLRYCTPLIGCRRAPHAPVLAPSLHSHSLLAQSCPPVLPVSVEVPCACAALLGGLRTHPSSWEVANVIEELKFSFLCLIALSVRGGLERELICWSVCHTYTLSWVHIQIPWWCACNLSTEGAETGELLGFADQPV